MSFRLPRIQTVLACSLVLLFVAAGILHPDRSFGKTEGETACFDFTRPIPPEWEADRRSLPSDALPAISGLVRVRVETVVGRSISAVAGELLAHERIRNDEISRQRVISTRNTVYWNFQTVLNEVRPFPLLTFEWEERWAFQLEKGSAEDPELIRAAYQKIRGTSHIQWLCGTFLVERLSTNRTRVIAYQEIAATRRSKAEVENGILQTLHRLGSQAD